MAYAGKTLIGIVGYSPVVDRFPLQGKVVVDVGSGTGISTFRLAEHADLVIGIEIEEAMISIS